MKTNKSLKLFMMLSLIYTAETRAQGFDDWEARPNVSLEYKINRKWKMAATYYLYLDKNMSQFDKSVFSGDVGYKINSWLKAGLDYRFGTNQKESYHDIRYSLTFTYKPSSKWELAYRPMLQHEFNSLNQAYLKEHPIDYYIRNRLTLSYDLSRNTEVLAFTETYLQPEQGAMNFYRQKSAVGAEYKINKRNKIGTRLEIINKRNGKNNARPNLNYTYTLGQVKK